MTDANAEDHYPELDLGKYHQLFLDEACGFLALLRRSLAQLLDAPGDKRAKSEARRAAHTLKGMAATMHYEELSALAKSMENQLQQEGHLEPGQIEHLLARCDQYEEGMEQKSGAQG
jgi:two-component system chemotaxis sensor kinase CheA